MLYLDTSASYPLLPEVISAMKDSFEKDFANPSSSHALGQEAINKVNVVREQLADSIGAYPSEVIFTSGATESNNIAFKSILLNEKFPKNKKHIITSQIEHKCILSICDYLKTMGFDISFVKPNEKGVIEAEDILGLIRPSTAFISIMHVNNELGTINPIKEIGEICFESDVLFHVDAAQSFQKLEIDVDELNVDLMSFSAHKIAGPKGIGALYIRDLKKQHLTPVIHGAGQEFGLRGGTVATPLIVGFSTAINYFSSYYQQFKSLDIKSYFLACLSKKEISFHVNGINAVENCLSITLSATATEVLIQKYQNKVCLAQGSACSSKEIEPSHVLTAIGLSRELADKTFRISFPLDVSYEDVEKLAEIIEAVS